MNENKFTKKARIYDKYRPRYAPRFINHLYTKTGFSKDSTVVDVGAGTGILSEEFLKRGTKTICVEPNREMLEEAIKKLRRYKNCRFVKSSAEKIALEKEIADFITVAQAFHWFDQKKFQKESRRVIKPNGKAVLVWNITDSTTPLSRDVAMINEEYCENYRGFNKRDEEKEEEYESFYSPFPYEKIDFENSLHLDEPLFIGRCLSRSYAPSKTDSIYEEYIKELKKIFKKYEKRGKVLIKNKTTAYIGRIK